MLFDWRASDQSTHPGLPVFARSGQNGTFARASGGSFVDAHGVLWNAVAGQPAITMVDADGAGFGELPALVLEAAGANLAPWSEDPTQWTAIGTPTLAFAGAFNGVGMYLIGDDDAAAAEAVRDPISFTGDAVKVVTVCVKQGSSVSSLIRIFDNNTSGNPFLGLVAWSAGGLPLVSAAAGVYLGAQPMANGSWRLFFATTSVTASHTHFCFFFPATDFGLVLGATGTVYAGGFQVEDSPVPTSYIKRASGAATRSAASLSFPFQFAAYLLTDFTVYVDVFVNGLYNYNELVLIGDSTNGVDVYLNAAGAVGEIRHAGGIVNASSALPNALMQRVQACVQLRNWPTGPSVRIDVGTGFSAYSSAGPARTALGANTLRLAVGSNGNGNAAFMSVLVAPGLQTRDFMMAIAAS